MKPSYVDVMRFLAQYATANLNMDIWRDEDKSKLLADVTAQNEDALDKLAAQRTKKDLGGDELDIIEVVMELEEEFQVQIDDGWLGERGDDPTMGELSELVVALRK